MAKANSSKTELERSALEMVKAARRLANIKKGDPLCTGTCKESLKHLSKLERRIRKLRKKGGSEVRVQGIAKELAQLIGSLCKFLIHCIYHFQVKCCCLIFSVGV